MGLINFIRSIFKRPCPPHEAKAEETIAPAPEPPVVPEEPPGSRWEVDMIPQVAGPGGAIDHKGNGGYWSGASVRLEWVSRETDAEGKPLRTRAPAGHTKTVWKRGFTAAGKLYRGLGELLYRREEGPGIWYRDIYGRSVLAVEERFPCFDSSDYLYENRYFRWYFLCQDDKLTCVYHTDGTDTVTITEDVLDLEKHCWREMNERKCFQ